MASNYATPETSLMRRSDFDTLHKDALQRAASGDFMGALGALDKALRLEPRNPAALSNRGAILRRMGRFAEALAWLDLALKHAPAHVEAFVTRGAVQFQTGRLEAALADFDRALALEPDYVEALVNRGAALRQLDRRPEAIEAYERALALRPESLGALNNLGVLLQDDKRFREALARYDAALALQPAHVEALVNRGLVLMDLQRHQAARESFERALALRPDHVEARYNLGWVSLQLGDFANGWRGYEERWNRLDAPPRKIAAFREWRGENLRGKRILIYEEQGLGDVIQFARFLGKLEEFGGEATLLVSPPLLRLLQSLTPPARVIATPPGAEETFDRQCALMSLPGWLGTTAQNIPAQIPYLSAEPERVDRWRSRLGIRGFKIGVCWQGNPQSKNDTARFVPLECFAPLAAIPGVRLISLQKIDGLDQLQRLAAELRIETLGEDFDAGPDAFVDTAAVVSCLDLVVAADTAIGHLAGALGRPAFLALKQSPDWRWMLGRQDTPWYPATRLYRQSAAGEWGEVFERMARDATKLAKGRNTS
jgi:tetratricopeptide (TPR) repeat protein